LVGCFGAFATFFPKQTVMCYELLLFSLITNVMCKGMKKIIHREAVDFLNDQCWHDSVLYEIRIIRTNSTDQVILPLNLITNYDEWEYQKTTLTFNDCYYIEAKMNGGVIAMSDGEMISEANANLSSPFIDQVLDAWRKIKVELSELFHFSILLASTGSEINIVSKSVCVATESDSEKHSAPPPIYPTR
jgi:hypothetical protein